MFLGEFWWFAIPGLILGIYAQMRLSSTYGKYVRVAVSNGMTGAQAARAILDASGLHNMAVNEIGGHLTDHYDPNKKALFLSSENYRGYSVAAVGVAAHEAGHAIQHRVGYAPLMARMWMVPATQFATYAWQGILIFGLVMGTGMFNKVLPIVIGIFAVITLFQVITLPVEFDASRRAKEQLFKLGLIRAEEKPAVAKVLNAAAMTYVAAMVSAVLTLLQLILMSRNSR